MSKDVTPRLEVELAEVKARLREADGLWEYWCSRDITENELEWAAFSDAVRDHLKGKPVPRRFLPKKPTEVRGNLDRAKVLLERVQKEAELWKTYAENAEGIAEALRQIRDLISPRLIEPDEAPDAEGVVEALLDTQAHIASCLAADDKLEAVRKVVDQYNDPGNEKFGSLVAMQMITTLLATPDVGGP